ncbi:MAG: hypothetical protein ACKV2U_10880 [Bryobacteraceae bacterium]
MPSAGAAAAFEDWPEDYLRLHKVLAKYFTYNCGRYGPDPLQLVDKTLDILAAVTADKEHTSEDLTRLAFGIAKNIAREQARKPRFFEFLERILPAPTTRFDQKCLQFCIDRLDEPEQTLLSEYYWVGAEAPSALHAHRLDQAKRLGISYLALLKRASRIIDKVRDCHEKCVERSIH